MNKKKYLYIIVFVIIISIFIGKLLLAYKNSKIACVFENKIIQEESSNEILNELKVIPNELQENTQIEENIPIEENISSNPTKEDVETVVKEETKQDKKPSQKKETISNNNKTITKNETIEKSNTDQEKTQITINKQIEETKPSNPQNIETQDNSNTKTDNYTEIEVTVVEKKECDGNNHKMGAGNTGLWFETKAQADNYYNSQIEKWGKLWESDQITKEEYLKECPSGYEVWTCPQCKKWTLNFYYR